MASQMDEMDRDAEPVRAPRTTVVRCQPLRFVPGERKIARKKWFTADYSILVVGIRFRRPSGPFVHEPLQLSGSATKAYVRRLSHEPIW